MTVRLFTPLVTIMNHNGDSPTFPLTHLLPHPSGMTSGRMSMVEVPAVAAAERLSGVRNLMTGWMTVWCHPHSTKTSGTNTPGKHPSYTHTHTHTH